MNMHLFMLETDEERAVFQKFYEKNNHMFYNIAKGILKTEEDAEDAVQNCFLRIVEKYDKYRSQTEENLTRLGCTIVKHEAIDMLRKKEKKIVFSDENFLSQEEIPDMSPDILEQLIQKTNSNLVTQAVMQLREEDRNLLYLRYVLDLKPKDIGELFDKNPSAVRKKLYQCRTKLVEVLKGDEYESLR